MAGIPYNRLLILTILLAAPMIGCERGREEVRQLPNGYTFSRSNSETAAIFVPDDKVLSTGGYYGPGITIIAVEGDKIFGRVEPNSRASIPQRTKAGYFVLDTDSGVFLSGMSELDFTKAGGRSDAH